MPRPGASAVRAQGAGVHAVLGLLALQGRECRGEPVTQSLRGSEGMGPLSASKEGPRVTCSL